MNEKQRLILLLLLVATVSCSTPGPELETADNNRDCNSGGDAYQVECRQGNFYVRDEMDLVNSGDNPLVAGCHVSYSDPDCTKDRKVYIGDQCLTVNKKLVLKEWTNTACHTPQPGGRIDRKTYDCDAYCKSIGQTVGTCETTVPNVCGPWPSAYCKCTGLQ